MSYYEFENVHKHSYTWYIDIDWEFLKEYHFNYDGDEEYKELTQKDYDKIVEQVADYYHHIEEDGDKIQEIVESYGVFKAMTLYNKLYDKKFKHTDDDYKNFNKLFLAILTEYITDKWSLKDFNDIYKENYDEYLESIADDEKNNDNDDKDNDNDEKNNDNDDSDDDDDNILQFTVKELLISDSDMEDPISSDDDEDE